MVYSKSAVLTLWCLVDLWCSHLQKLWITTLWCWLQGKNLSIDKRRQHVVTSRAPPNSLLLFCVSMFFACCWHLFLSNMHYNFRCFHRHELSDGQNRKSSTGCGRTTKPRGDSDRRVCLDNPPSSDPIDCTASATTPVVGEDVKDGARSI